MSRRCDISGKTVQTGNNVSHAMNHTRRRFLPNLHVVRLQSDILGERIKMRLSTRTVRTIDKNGGIDEYLLGTPDRKLTDEAKKLKRRIERRQAQAAS
ncbi:MAG: 50S ribosomal protein L28 [Alphaproteobacteria bacterium]